MNKQEPLRSLPVRDSSNRVKTQPEKDVKRKEIYKIGHETDRERHRPRTRGKRVCCASSALYTGMQHITPNGDDYVGQERAGSNTPRVRAPARGSCVDVSSHVPQGFHQVHMHVHCLLAQEFIQKADGSHEALGVNCSAAGVNDMTHVFQQNLRADTSKDP